MNPIPEYRNLVNRRLLLRGAASSIGVAALSSLMSQDSVAGTNGLITGGTHFAPRAKRVVYLFQSGGPSHLELFDPKPKLNPSNHMVMLIHHPKRTLSQHIDTYVCISA